MDTILETSDVDLIVAALKGDQSSFGALLERHLSSVYKFAYRYVRDPHDAEDIAQEAFVRAWKHLKKFDTSKNFKTWIFTIAKNAALDFLKKKKPILFSRIAEEDGELEMFLAPYVASGELPDAILDKKFLKADIEKAFKKLPPAYRAVLSLRYHDHLKFREIAEALGEPIDTVKSKHRRGVILLRDIFSS